MQNGPPRKEVPKGKVFIWSITICHLTPVNVVAWLWEACDEVFQRDLFPLCPPSVLDSIGCLLFGPCRRALTPPEIISDPACFSSYLLHLGDLIGRRARLAALWLHLVSQILHRAAFNLSSCSEPSAIPVVTAFATTFSSMLGEGNGNPLQYSCLANPMDRGAW